MTGTNTGSFNANESPQAIPVIGIGASAGGIEALEAFFKELPPDSGAAFVVIQHLDPHHKSILAEIIQRFTPMHVIQVESNMSVVSNHVYVIPPNTRMALFNGKLQLFDLDENIRLRLPIDFFFRSLADDLHVKAVGIILSGTGSDGTLGLKEIKGAGGMIMAQEIASAGYDGMPRSAIATGLVDFILPPEKMPEILMSYLKQTFDSTPLPTVSTEPQMSDAVAQILLMIRLQTGHDFSHYKSSTIIRRIERLMAVNQIEDIADYVRFLQNNVIGIEALFRDMLIGVTSFFRDKDVFERLKQIMPLLFQERHANEGVRIWVPGCSTGEEAYSLAMLLHEYMETLKQAFKVQIFATDIDTQAVNQARLGIYPLTIAADVPEAYLQRYFFKTDQDYRITKSLRDMLVFAQHNVTKDPPFSKLDLISCRNLLIYFDTTLQERVLSYFHFALLPAGYLVLGTSESVGKNERDFKTIDLAHKIFQTAEDQPAIRFKANMMVSVEPHLETNLRHSANKPPSIREITEAMLLADWSPACIVIDYQGTIRYVHGRTGKYLELSAGEVDKLDIIRSAREGLKMPLTTAIYRAITQQREIYEPGVWIKTERDDLLVNLTIKPLNHGYMNDNLLAVLFEEVTLNEAISQMPLLPMEDRDQKYGLIQQELNDTREYLQAAIEELKSSNEEMQSVNEELQSTNEELETSQEELRAVNEELLTINAELEKKVEELTWANNDLSNILNNIQIGIILLDDRFQIRRYNPAAQMGFHLIPGDIGRLITHVVSNLEYPTLFQDIETVFNTLTPHEIDITAGNGQHYLMQIRPYRTSQNAIKGVVIAFTSISGLQIE